MRHFPLPHGSAALALGLAAALLGACGGGRDAAHGADLASRCAAFAPVALPLDARVDAVQYVPAGETRPELCIVRGRFHASGPTPVHFKIDLPSAAAWNRKSLTVGGGGFDGFIITDLPGWSGILSGGHPASVARYAVLTSDSGHRGEGSPMQAQLDFSWARGNDAGLRDHAYLANHFTLQVGVAIIQHFYGQPPARRYMIGLSNGGRSGLIAAQRFPEDYHGVVALAPAISQQAYAVNVGASLLSENFMSPARWLSPQKIELFQQAQIAACDLLDNLADGVIGNHEACDFDPAALLCPDGDAAHCLTAAQVDSVRRILSPTQVPLELAHGMVGYPAFGRGAETEDWPVFMFGPSPEAPGAVNFILAQEIVRHGITQDPSADLRLHNPLPWAARYREVSEIIDATDPDLSVFHQAGGKLLIWHGSADGCVSYRRTAQYHARVVAHMGEAAVDEFMRFFVSPGVAHGLTGPGANAVDFLAALEHWVEGAQPPQTLRAAKRDAQGATLFTRPVCRYPLYPRYKGTGDSSSAESFECAPV